MGARSQLPQGAVNVEPSTGFTAEQADSLRSELHEILASTAFHSSKRSSRFLSHVVEQVLLNRRDSLKERALGVELFDRDPSYDTGEDAAVRVAAGEVRKRLAQYYLDHPPRLVRIDLPSGSYVPEFHWLPQEVPASTPAPAARPGAVRLAKPAALAAAILILALAASYVWVRRPTVVDRFWEPVLDRKEPVLVCVGQLQVFSAVERMPSLLDRYQRTGCPDGPGCAVFLRDLTPLGGAVLPLSDAIALAQVARLLTEHGRAFQVRPVSDTPYPDLRDRPVALIGALSNRWTTHTMAGARFTFRHLTQPGISVIVDNEHPDDLKWRVTSGWPWLKNDVDYGIISRWRHPQTGAVLILTAGLSPFATQAAAELATNRELLAGALQDAPSDWRSKNVQLVFRIGVVDGNPGRPTVIARHFW